MRRFIAGMLPRQHGKQRTSYFEPRGPYGVATPGRMKATALRATLDFQEGVPSYLLTNGTPCTASLGPRPWPLLRVQRRTLSDTRRTSTRGAL